MENGKCICGKRTRMRKDGTMGKTCGNRSCSGKLAKIHMNMVLNKRHDNRWLKKSVLPYRVGV